jgi:hypothetical protein
LSIIPTMLAVWLAGWNVHLVSKYHLNVLSMSFQFHEKKMNIDRFSFSWSFPRFLREFKLRLRKLFVEE